MLGYKVDDSGRDQYNKDIDQTKQKQQSLTASFLKANLIMGAVSKGIGAAFGFIRDSVIGATAETERYRVTLGTMIGDQEKANKIIHDLDYSPVSDFYGTANAIGGLQGMVTFGMQAEEASDTLTRLGDIAQGNSEAFVSMSLNMGQVFAKGKADATDLKQFVTQGFDVVGEVAKQSGKSREEIEKAGVTYQQTAAALKALTSEGGKYEGMLSKQMNTLGGVLKQFESFKAATAESIGFGISEELKEILKYILEIGRAGQESFVNGFVNVLKTVIHWIFQLIIMWEVLGYRLEDMGAFTVLKKFFDDLRTTAGYVITGIMNYVVALGKVLIQVFKTAYGFIRPILLSLGPLFQSIYDFAAKMIQGIIPIIQMVGPPLAVVGTILGIIITGLSGIIDFLSPLAPLIGGIIAIVKIWTAVHWLLNAAMMANPIGLIVAAVIAGVALIVGLVMVIIKNWNKIKETAKKVWSTVCGVVKAAVDFIRNVFGKIGEFFGRIWGGIKDAAGKAWSGIKEAAGTAWEGMKNAGATVADFFKNRWNDMKEVGVQVFSFLDNHTGGALSRMRDNVLNMVNNVKEFFSGLWEAIKQGPGEVIEYIKNAFFGLFESIKEKFFGFINVIKEGWGNVKGFFGGIKEGVVNFVTGGENGGAAAGGLQPAYAGGTPQGAAARTVGQTSNYSRTSYGGSSTVNATTSISVNVPKGTTQQQQQAIAQQVGAQFDARLAGQINASRANIPSPEVRRR